MWAVNLYHNAQNCQANSSVNRWKHKVQTCESDRFLNYVQEISTILNILNFLMKVHNPTHVYENQNHYLDFWN